VLLRLGYGEEDRRYERSHRSAQAAAEAELPARVPPRREASLLLRRHGQTICRRSKPRCDGCPLERQCPSAGIA
jgi:endonuclease III